MATISVSDPKVILAGIRHFGLASDGSDLRDLEDAINRARQDGRREGLEEAARVADSERKKHPIGTFAISADATAERIAKAIRALATGKG